MIDPADYVRSGKRYCVVKFWKLEQLYGYAYFDDLDDAREYQAENGGVIKVKMPGFGYIDLEAITRWFASMSERCQKNDHNESNII